MVATGWCGVVATVERLVRIFVGRGGGGDGGTSISSIVRWAHIVTNTRSKRTGGGGTSRHFGVAETAPGGAAAALPELDAGAASVAIGWRRTKALLLLVVAVEGGLDEGGDEEE